MPIGSTVQPVRCWFRFLKCRSRLRSLDPASATHFAQEKFTVFTARHRLQKRIFRRWEFSADGGETWHLTRLKGESVRNAWRFWEFDWQTPTKRGKATLMAKATDSLGCSQPIDRDKYRGGYIVNHVLPIEVDVR
jgi:hypothetical protein